jgi:hypothetical protein
MDIQSVLTEVTTDSGHAIMIEIREEKSALGGARSSDV